MAAQVPAAQVTGSPVRRCVREYVYTGYIWSCYGARGASQILRERLETDALEPQQAIAGAFLYVIALQVICMSHGCRMFHVCRDFDVIYPGLCWPLT